MQGPTRFCRVRDHHAYGLTTASNNSSGSRVSSRSCSSPSSPAGIQPLPRGLNARAATLGLGLACEPLERRLLLSSTLLSGMADAMADQMTQVRGQIFDSLADQTQPLGQVPIVGPQAAQAAAFLDGLAAELVQQVNALPAGATGADLEDLLNGFDAISNASASLGDDTVTLSMDLSHAVTLLELDIDFDIGLRSLPFYIDTSGGVVGELVLSYENFAFTYHDPGDDNPPVFTLDTDTDALSISAMAGLSEDAILDATVGYLRGTISDSAKPGLQTALNAVLSLDVVPGGVDLAGVSGSAMVALDLTVEIQGAFPDLRATFVLDWADMQSAPQAEFQDVRISLGGAIGNIMGPLVTGLEPVLKTLEPVTNLLTTPLPVLDEIGLEVSLLSLAEAVNDLGLIPDGYSNYVEAFTTIVNIIDVLQMFETAGDDEQSLEIVFGDFQLTGENDADLRFENAKNALTDDELSSLAVGGVTGDFNIAQLQSFLNNNLPSQLADPLNEVIDRLTSGISFDLPLLSDPASAIFPVLIGREAQLATLTIKYESPADTDFSLASPSPFPLGLSGGLDVSLDLGIDLELGLDTFGLRSFIASDFAEPLRLLDGFYIRDGSTMFINGHATAFLTAGFPFFGASVEGGLSAGLSLTAKAPADPSDEVDNDPSRVRLYSELLGCLFHVEGSVKAFIDFAVKIGVQIPVVGFVGYSKTFNIAEAPIYTLSGCLADPFNPPDIFLADYDPDTGVLTLNMGSQERREARNFEVDEINESFLVTPDGDGVAVSAFGVIQRFPIPELIVAHTDDGDDFVRIAAGVDVNAILTGGNGDDRLEYLGDGHVTMQVFGGNNIMLSNAPRTTMFAGPGDDVLISHNGVITNFLSATAGGNNRLEGGLGSGTLLGGDGNDTLIAGSGGDWMQGGNGNNLFILGAGNDTAIGGLGDDEFVWEAGAGHSIIIGGDGAGENQLGMSGTDLSDLFDVTVDLGSLQALADTGAFGPRNIFATNIHRLTLDGLGGEDTAIVTPERSELPPLGRGLHTIVINGADMLQPDGAVDTIELYGTTDDDGPIDDQIEIEQFEVMIADAFIGDTVEEPPVFGGMMRVGEIFTYDVFLTNINDDLTVDAREGSDLIEVFSITGPTRVTGGPGDNAVFVYAENTAEDTLLGDYPVELHVYNEHDGKNLLEVNLSDAGNIASVVNTFVTDSVVSSDVQMLLSEPVSLLPGVIYDPGSVSGNLRIVGSNFRDEIHVASTRPEVFTQIFGGDGNDNIHVSSHLEGLGGNLSQIRGVLVVDGGGGDNVLNLIDAAATSGNQNVLISGNAVTGFAGPADDTPVVFDSSGGKILVQLWGSNSPALFETYTVDNPGAEVAIHDNAGSSAVYIHRTAHRVEINGGAGDDTVYVGQLTNSLDEITAPIHVIGGPGNDAVYVFDTAAPAGTGYELHEDRLVRGFAEVHFDDTLELLSIQTSDQEDVVFVHAMPVAARTLLNQNGGTDALVGPNIHNTWRITGTNSGVLNDRLSFVSSEALLGGSGADHFLIHHNSSIEAIFGGPGPAVDVLDYSSFRQAVTVDYSGPTPTATAVGAHVGINRLIGSPRRNDELIGSSAENVFELTGPDSGSLSMPNHGLVAFHSIENLGGGPEMDLFIVHETGSLTGSINGGGGSNILDYTPSVSSVVVDLGKERATRIRGKVIDIQNAVGGLGDDILLGSAADNILVGGGGNNVLVGRGGLNVLFGGAGRNILIGGPDGLSVLVGGSDDDILIAGTTEFDDNVNALRRLMNEWSRQDLGFQQRINNLRDGGGLNGGIKLNADTVTLTADASVLFGGGASNWFWADPDEDILPDFAVDDQLN